MDMTLESLDSEIIEIENNPKIVGNYAYFKPFSLLAIYRIDKRQYKSQLQESMDYFLEMADHCEEVINVNQIYDYLKDYDYDERVEDLLKKI